MTTKMLLVILGGIFFSQLGSATMVEQLFGAISGGGGKGVVCRDHDKVTVRLLDLWESEVLYGKRALPVTGELEHDVETLLLRLRDSYEFKGMGGIGSEPAQYKDQELVLALMRMWASKFYGDSPDVLRLREVTLTLTDDSYELAKPSNCAIEQIVNFQPTGRILVNQDLFEKMDSLNQAALIAHEAFYSLLRDFAHESNSIRTRRSIGLVSSGYIFAQIPPPIMQAPVTCAQDVINGDYVLTLYQNSDSVPGHSNLGIYPNLFEGSKLLGIPRWDYQFSFSNWSHFLEALVGGKCLENFRANIRTQLEGPVEFDRDLNLVFSCQDGIAELGVNRSRPGSPLGEIVPLKCNYPKAPAL